MNLAKRTLQLIKSARLIDGINDQPIEQGAVLVEGKYIVQVGPTNRITLPEGVNVVEHSFTECSVLPGLIDTHTHLNMPGDGRSVIDVMEESDDSLLLRSAQNGRIALHSGVTTLRDNGGRKRTIFSLRKAVTDGVVVGPRLNICGWPITITMGHCYPMGGEADGLDGVRKAVRQLIGKGADYIKVMASGGETPSSFPFLPSYTLQELEAIVDEAHRFGKLVAAHCTCTQAVVNALEAQVDMLIHCHLRESNGSWNYQPKIVERIAKAEVWVNPTIHLARMKYRVLLDRRDRKIASPELDEQLAEAKESWVKRCEFFRHMVDNGVKVVAGGDTGWGYVRFGNFVYEIEAMQEAGLSTMRAIQSATRDAAKSMGMDNTVGTLEIGKEADILIVEGDPLKQIADLINVKAVFKAGERVC